MVDIIAEINNLSATQDLSLTTNGYLLVNQAQSLYDAGLKRINISLDSLNQDTFDQIIGNHGKSRWHQNMVRNTKGL